MAKPKTANAGAAIERGEQIAYLDKRRAKLRGELASLHAANGDPANAAIISGALGEIEKFSRFIKGSAKRASARVGGLGRK